MALVDWQGQGLVTRSKSFETINESPFAYTHAEDQNADTDTDTGQNRVRKLFWLSNYVNIVINEKFIQQPPLSLFLLFLLLSLSLLLPQHFICCRCGKFVNLLVPFFCARLPQALDLALTLALTLTLVILLGLVAVGLHIRLCLCFCIVLYIFCGFWRRCFVYITENQQANCQFFLIFFRPFFGFFLVLRACGALSASVLGVCRRDILIIHFDFWFASSVFVKAVKGREREEQRPIEGE